MILSVHDFPIKFEDNCIKNCKGKILFNLSKKAAKRKGYSVYDRIPTSS